MNSNNKPFNFWSTITKNKVAFLSSFIFAISVFVLEIIKAKTTNNRSLDFVFSLSVLLPFVFYLYYKASPQDKAINLGELLTIFVNIFIAHIFIILAMMLITGILFHQSTNLTNILSIIFLLQIFTGFFISILHGLLPLIKVAKKENIHFLKLSYFSVLIVLVTLINKTTIEHYLGYELSQISLAVALTLTTTIIIHFLSKYCSRNDSHLLKNSVKVFLIIASLIIWMRFGFDRNQTQTSIDSLLLLSTSLLLPVAVSFLFSSILVIVDQKIPQSKFRFSTFPKDARVYVLNFLETPVFILHFLIIKLLSIPLK